MDSTDETEEKDNYINNETGEDSAYVPDADTTCVMCQAEFLDPDDLTIHLNQVHKIARSVLKKCQLCTEVYSDLMEYAEHIRDNHLISLKLCSLCYRVFDDFDAHRKHCQKHLISKSNSMHSCSQCPQKFAVLFWLKKHEYEHRDSREGVIMHEIFPYLSAALKVKSITFIDSIGTDVVYICVGCDFSSVNMFMYLRHVRTNECKVFVCHICSSVFKKKKGMIKHLRGSCNIFGEREKKIKLCPYCKVYFPVVAYGKHKKHCKPIKCYTCDIPFSTMNEWSDHQSKEHPSRSIEVETCQFCLKRCVGSVAMKKHIDKTHKPEFHMYKYLCIYCKSVFKHPQKLFGHFVTKHKDIFPYTCKICDKTFRYRKKFTIHIKMSHNSVGFVEFDENYHVFFTEKKSENPFVPKSLYLDDIGCSTTRSSIDSSENIGLNSDFMNPTDTEDNQTDAYVKEKPKLKRKRNSKIRKQNSQELVTIETSDDDEPLNAVRKRVRFQKKSGIILPRKNKQLQMSNRKSLTCKTCNKYCYTYQNYKHHISLHSKHEVKTCIKCNQSFKSKTKLNDHIATAHSSSKLTETLKTLLEKRKMGRSLTEDLPMSVKFRRTVIKAKTEVTPTSAKITETDHKVSVQSFFENFVPEDNVNSVATIKLVTGYAREPMIKMKKFIPKPISSSLKLAMPVKFVDHYPEKTKVTIKLVEAPCKIEAEELYSDNGDDNIDMDRHESIPDVAEEVMLENTEETPKQPQNDIQHKIVIPKLPTQLTDIRIAHLLPEAPFYKIVKIKDVLTQTGEQKVEDTSKKPPTAIKLPDGTKLVTTNPLAHLLGDKQQEVLKAVKNKYYKSKNQNFEGLLAKAIKMLDKPAPSKKKKKEVENVEENK